MGQSVRAARRRQPEQRSGRRRGLMRLAAGSVAGLTALAGASVALAAASPPTAGGHYAGRTSQGLSVRVRVSGNRSEFAGGRIYFRLHGGCHARRFLSVSPTPPPAIKINSFGKVLLQRHIRADLDV